MKFYLTKKAQLEAEGRSLATAPGTAGASKANQAPNPVKESRANRRVSAAPATPDPSSFTQPMTQAAAPSIAGASPSVVATPTTASEPMAPNVKRSRTATEPKQREEKVPAVQKQKKGVIAIGGVPRVDLLPPEVRLERRAATKVRRAWTGVVVLAVLVAAAGGTAFVYRQSADSALASAQSQTSALSAQTAKYSEVKVTQGKVDLIDAARTVGGSTDIDWPTYLAKVQATLPAGMSMATVTIDSASPVVAYAQATSPLEGQRIATLAFSATSASLPSVPAWLTNLTQLPGYTDASAGTVSLASGVYTANVVVHVDEKAFSNAYDKKGK